MNRLPFVCLLVLAGYVSPADAAAKPSTLYVATNGNDSWSGTQPSANKQKSDGPLATLRAAVETIRRSRQGGNATASQRVTVFIRGGTYFLKEPLVLKPEDSGIILSAYRNEKPILSGGRRIGGWKETMMEGKKLWAAEVPEARQGQWFFHELWVNGTRAVRARHPNHGYLHVEELPDKAAQWSQGQTRFRFREGDLKPWKTAANAEVIVMDRWVESRLPIVSVDEKERLVTFAKRSVFELQPGDLYYVEHALELLDEPGEWYLEPSTGMLYYQPRPGEQLDRIEAIAPVLTQVVRLEGLPPPNPQEKATASSAPRFVQNVAFRGLTFSHTEWFFPGGFRSGKDRPQASPGAQLEPGGFSQAAVGVPGTVWGEGASGCVFEDCAFTHVGNYGLELARACQQNRILGCEFSDLGAGGLKIGEPALREVAEDQSRGTEISDCDIHDGGKMFASAIGLWIGQSPDNRVTHNHIHDFYYTGISVGWTWGYGKSLATNNIFEFNHIDHIGVKSDGDGPTLSDMGGIYTLGNEAGTIVRNNLWHDIAGLRYGGWGIYFDEGSSGILAENNLVYRTTHGGFHQHYGETNLVRNNIFAFARDHQLQRSRDEPHISFTFETNIVYFDSGVLLASNWSDDNFRMDWNLYFDARPAAKAGALRFGTATLDQWRARKQDPNSLVADPLFVAPGQNNFNLRADSPAFKLGFRPIDLSQVGPRKRK